MTTLPRQLPPETVQKILSALRNSPSQMTLQLARQLEVPEVEIIRRLPEGRSTELEVARWEELFQALADMGEVHVIVSNESVTCEVVGVFGGFSTWGEFFNVQTRTLDLHIRYEQLGEVFAVEKPSHTDGVNTLSLQFFDHKGNASLKAFASFGGQPASAERTAQFSAIRDRFRR